MSELINKHKRMAMMGMEEANHLKKGGKVKKYAKGGAVGKGDPRPWSHAPDSQLIGAYPESKVRNLPAKGVVPKLTPAMPHSVATMKKGGMTKKSGRGR